MKKVAIVLMVWAMGGAVWAQNEIQLDYVEVSGIKNKPIHLRYLTQMQQGVISEKVLDMQHKVASFDLKKSSLYKKDKTIAQVDFVGKESHIIAKYDRNGKLVGTQERFKDVTFPLDIRKAVYKNNQGWKVVRNIYNVNYDDRQLPNRTYKIWLEKDGKKRKVMMDVGGTSIAWVD